MKFIPLPHLKKYELRRPYQWRFWSKLQSDDITIFDRTWYGRVLVERVEGFATEVEWQRAYAEINRFEKNLSNSQTVLIKFWLAIDKDEQAARFKARESLRINVLKLPKKIGAIATNGMTI